MGELLAVTCDSCGEPMVPNVSTLDDDGCGWICLDPGCPELAAGESWRPRTWWRPACLRRSPADLARLRGLLLKLGSLAAGAHGRGRSLRNPAES